MEIYKVWDTSAFVNACPREITKFDYISWHVLEELESIKNSNKDEQVKANARKLVKLLIYSGEAAARLLLTDEKREIEDICSNYDLNLSTDNLIVAEAAWIAKLFPNCKIQFITSDGTQYLIVKRKFPELEPIFINGDKTPLWPGYRMIDKDDKEDLIKLSTIKHQPDMNAFNLVINEYLIYDETVLKWNGEKHIEIFPKDIRSIMIGDKIKPLNIEQVAAFDLLQNESVTIKLLTGKYGSGKDYLMFNQALSLVEQSKFNKIIFFRNLITLADTPDVGFLPGDLAEKTSWAFGPICDIVGGQEGLTQLIESNQLEFCHLPFARGRSFENSIIYVTEGQNLSKSQIALLLGRCGAGTQIWINADIQQTDSKIFERDSGVKKLIEKLKGHKLFGQVCLTKTLRSETAELAAKLLS